MLHKYLSALRVDADKNGVVHFVRTAERLGIAPGAMFELLNEMHAMGVYQNCDHVYGRMLAGAYNENQCLQPRTD